MFETATVLTVQNDNPTTLSLLDETMSKHWHFYGIHR
jgi:hypothetical protein